MGRGREGGDILSSPLDWRTRCMKIGRYDNIYVLHRLVRPRLRDCSMGIKQNENKKCGCAKAETCTSRS